MVVPVDPEAQLSADMVPVAQMEPSQRTLAELDKVFDEWVDESWGIEDADPLDLGVSIGDVAWGWLPTFQIRAYEPIVVDSWRLAPMDFRARALTVASASAWMAASMTGGVYTTRLECDGRVWVESWREDDGGVTLMDLGYGAVTAHRTKHPISGLFGDILDVWEPFCPCCSDEGWVVSVGGDEDLVPGINQWAWSRVYRVCDRHAGGCSFSSDGSLMTWTGTGWAINADR